MKSNALFIIKLTFISIYNQFSANKFFQVKKSVNSNYTFDINFIQPGTFTTITWKQVH